MPAIFFSIALVQALCSYPLEPGEETEASLRALAQSCRGQITAHPEDTTAYQVLGYALIDAPAEALRVYRAGLLIAPNNSGLLVNAGLTYRRLGRLSEALTTLLHASRVDTTEADALVQAGLVAQELGHYSQAILLFRHALHRHNHGPTWGYMARSYHDLGMHPVAVQCWDRAESLTPHGFIGEAGDREAYNQSRRAIGLAPRTQ